MTNKRAAASIDADDLAFEAFSARHSGVSVIVCGCGSSLHELPHNRNLITVGVNDVGRHFDPTYLVVVNPPRQFRGNRFEHVRSSRAQALFTQLDLGPVQPPVVRFALGRYGGTEIGPALHYTQNSPYVAVCLAAYMGARRIGLIGVDFTDHHFFAATGRHPLMPRLAQIDREYAALAAGLAAQGVELVNLSAQSRLQSLRMQSLVDWLAGAEQPAAAGPHRFKLDLVPAPAVPGEPPAPSACRLFIVGFRFLTCGDVVSDGLEHAAQALGLAHARAEWDDPALPKKVEAFEPDWLLVVHGRRFVQRWRQRFDGWRRGVWLMDEPYEVDDTASWSDRFDAVFVNDASTLSRHPRASVLPLAFDPTLHRDIGQERVHRVGFVGGASPARERLLVALAEAGLLSYVVGGPWSDPRLKRSTLAVRTSPAETAALYQRTQIVVNVFRDRHHWNRHALPATAMNPRIYEAMACGAVVLSERRPELRNVFPHLPCFEDAASLVDRLRALLGDPAALARLRAQGLAAVASHRYADRLQQALAVMAPAPAAFAAPPAESEPPAEAAQLQAATLDMPLATPLAVPPATLSRPAANHSPPRSATVSERQPLRLMPLPATPRRHLMYHLWPVRGSTWRWNVQQLLQRIELFNGRRLVGIVTDDRSEDAEAVMELFAGHGCEYEVQPNGPAGEAATFPRMLQRLQAESRQDVAFYGHAKGVKYEPQFPPAVRRWAEVQYQVMLDHWSAVRAQLQTHAMTGMLRRVGRFANHQRLGDWHYSGTFFWMRHDAVFARPWQQVPAFYGAVEAWPGLLFTRQEASCLLLDQLHELPYHPRFWALRGDPALAQWRRLQRPLPVPPDLAQPPGFEGQALPRLEHKPEEFAWLMQRLRAADTRHLLVIAPSPSGDRADPATEDAAAWHARRHFATAGLTLQVSTLAGGAPPAPGMQADAVLIDGDHGYAACRRDLLAALALRPRLVALHDIVDSDWHAAMGCCVSRLWSEMNAGQAGIGDLQGRFESFAGSGWGGVGMLHLGR